MSVLEEEHKARLSLLHSEKQRIAELLEEIKHLKEEITKQKDFSVQNEKHLKEEMEKVTHITVLLCMELSKLRSVEKAKEGRSSTYLEMCLA